MNVVFSSISSGTLQELYAPINLLDARNIVNFFPIVSPEEAPLLLPPTDQQSEPIPGLSPAQRAAFEEKTKKAEEERVEKNMKRGLNAVQPLRGPVFTLLACGKPSSGDMPLGTRRHSTRRIYPAHQPTAAGVRAMLSTNMVPTNAQIGAFVVAKIRPEITMYAPLGAAQLGASTVDLSASKIAQPIQNRWGCTPQQARWTDDAEMIEAQLNTIKPGTPIYARGEQDPAPSNDPPKSGFQSRKNQKDK